MTSSTDTPTEPVTRGTNYSKPNKVGRVTSAKQKSNLGSACFLLLTVLTLRLFLADTCTICGISAVHARCATCLQRLCLKCDKLYHSHPDRKGHNRTITTPAKTSRWEEKPTFSSLFGSRSKPGRTQAGFVHHFLCYNKGSTLFDQNSKGFCWESNTRVSRDPWNVLTMYFITSGDLQLWRKWRLAEDVFLLGAEKNVVLLRCFSARLCPRGSALTALQWTRCEPFSARPANGLDSPQLCPLFWKAPCHFLHRRMQVRAKVYTRSRLQGVCELTHLLIKGPIEFKVHLLIHPLCYFRKRGRSKCKKKWLEIVIYYYCSLWLKPIPRSSH